MFTRASAENKPLNALHLTAQLERNNRDVGRGEDLDIPAEQVAAVVEAFEP